MVCISGAPTRIAADEIKKRKLLEVKRERRKDPDVPAEADQKVVGEYWGFHLHKEKEGASPRWLD